MQPAEKFRVLLFLAVVVMTYALAGGVLVRLLLRRLGRVPPFSRQCDWMHQIILGAATFGLLCMAYGYFIEPYWLEVTRVHLSSHKLLKDARPIRIVHISDLHCDRKPRLEERIPSLIAAEKPDLIVFTGDSVNEPAGIYVLKPLLKQLAAIAPTFAVRGNWDVWYWHKMDLFGGTGIRELNGNAVNVKIGSTEVWLTGVWVDNEGQTLNALKNIPPDAFTIFLHHYPDLIEEVVRRDVDLYCAGHTHGGQVALPFYGALMTLSRFGKRYEAGLYRENNTWLYVNRGIGMEGGTAPRVRFCARPEITVIEISPEK